jgi:hypothetical protein
MLLEGSKFLEVGREGNRIGRKDEESVGGAEYLIFQYLEEDYTSFR